MTESDQASPAWRERAAFHVTIDYTNTADGQLIWQTRAYHEESDTHRIWPGVPGESLINWLIAVAELPANTQALPQLADAQEREPSPSAEETLPAPADDFKQIIGISAATEQRLHEAGIRSYAQLAASAPSELSALLDIPAERITRRGWITRARALAKLAKLPGTTARRKQALKQREEQARPAQAEGMLFVEVRFDENGDIFDQRLLREDLLAPEQLMQQEGQVARFFIEQSTLSSGPETLAAPDISASELEIEIDDLQIEEASGSQSAPVRLRARSVLRLAGLAAEQLFREQARYLAQLLAYNLESGETRQLASTGGQFSTTMRDEQIEMEFETPEVGRYQLVIAVVLIAYETLGTATGPRLRVNP